MRTIYTLSFEVGPGLKGKYVNGGFQRGRLIERLLVLLPGAKIMYVGIRKYTDCWGFLQT